MEFPISEATFHLNVRMGSLGFPAQYKYKYVPSKLTTNVIVALTSLSIFSAFGSVPTILENLGLEICKLREVRRGEDGVLNCLTYSSSLSPWKLSPFGATLTWLASLIAN